MRQSVTAARSNAFRSSADSVVVVVVIVVVVVVVVVVAVAVVVVVVARALLAIHRDGFSTSGRSPPPVVLSSNRAFHAVAPVNTSYSSITLLQFHPVIS